MKKAMPLPEPWSEPENAPHSTALPGAQDVLLPRDAAPAGTEAATPRPTHRPIDDAGTDAACRTASVSAPDGPPPIPLPGEDFSLEEEPRRAGTEAAPAAACPGQAQCPLARIPESAWKELFRRPFRRRHPVIFWGIVLLVLAGLVFALLLDEDDLAGERLALLEIRGPINDVRPHLEWLGKVAADPDVKGLLVRVDSPGGSAAASQELYEAVAALGKRMPVAVSMGSVAASGGLMVSMAGKRIFANAATVTGSIGVRMDIPQIRQLLDKIGVGQETLTTGPFKDAGSMLRPLTREEREYFEGLLKDMHDIFVAIIAEARDMPRAKVAELASGKVFTGREALRLGLVDELGTVSDARRWLAGQCGVPADRKLMQRPREDAWWRQPLQSLWQALLGPDATAAGTSPAFLYQM
ncbi:signal peptide peptidase SppA [uncultured Desulfovibrio sp.]|uniref:signal peptide peptidase SppA n=1 Tax=uncultured Desulfovibrio sp. TaxID=167968 RepID=UPI002613D360|nr:signal peptide peptidase SppA [uncultured Desulfovibrio sp.]